MSIEQYIEQGRFLRGFASEPVSSLVRSADLAFCASRLLRLAQAHGTAEGALGALIETTLERLSRVDPEGAVESAREAQYRFADQPATWALSCHVLAQVLSEFSRETSPQLINELRQVLPDWFGRLRATLSGESRVLAKPARLSAIQIQIAQSAIFHDAGSLEWGTEMLVHELDASVLGDEIGIESAGLAAGLCGKRRDDPTHQELVRRLLPVASGGRYEVGVMLDHLGAGNVSLASIQPAAMEDVAPHGGGGARKPPKKKSAGKKAPGTGLRARLESFVENNAGLFAWVVLPIVVIGIVVLCVGGVGKLLNWTFSTAPVGDQSLSQWYESNEARRQPAPTAESAAEAMEQITSSATEQLEADAPESQAATPWLSRETPLGEEAELAYHLEETVRQHHTLMRAAVGVPRIITETGGREVRTVGEGTVARHEMRQGPDGPVAVGTYFMRWYENGRPAGDQAIVVRYAWRNVSWELVDAVRVRGDGSQVDDTADKEWARNLFRRNPFY